MQQNIFRPLTLVFAFILIAMPACSTPAGTTIPPSSTPEETPLIPVAGPLATAIATASRTPVPSAATASIQHNMWPADPKGGKVVYDVESSGTAPEHRAPYGDSYDINRLERPFSDHMIYVPELDTSNLPSRKTKTGGMSR